MEISGRSMTNEDQVWLEEKMKTQEHVSALEGLVPDAVPLPPLVQEVEYLG
jgi:hypothetical protein